MDHSSKGSNNVEFSVTAEAAAPQRTISLQSMSGRGLIGLTQHGINVYSALTEAYDATPLKRVMSVETFAFMMMNIVEDNTDTAFWRHEKLDLGNAKALLIGALNNDTEIIAEVLHEIRLDQEAIMQLVKDCAFSPREGDDDGEADSEENIYTAMEQAYRATRPKAPVISMAEFKTRRNDHIASSTAGLLDVCSQSEFSCLVGYGYRSSDNQRFLELERVEVRVTSNHPARIRCINLSIDRILLLLGQFLPRHDWLRCLHTKRWSLRWAQAVRRSKSLQTRPG
ncbi:MAG: hypothetical protein ING75_15205 [Rhodocyclaceae bacterium]|nr:hypothetical protein [Rhodocyclaceae bacterium]